LSVCEMMNRAVMNTTVKRRILRCIVLTEFLFSFRSTVRHLGTNIFS
jgi:hypothetical protein